MAKRISELPSNTGLAADTVMETEKDPSGTAASEHATLEELAAYLNRQAVGIVCSDEGTALTAGAAKVTFRMPFKFKVLEARATLTTDGIGATTVDVNANGASIFTTPITVDSGSKSSVGSLTPSVIANDTLVDDTEMTVDIDAVGTGTTGLKLWLVGYPLLD